MAAHSPLTTVIPTVPPDQPPGALPAWLRGMAESINLIASKHNNPTPEAMDIAELQQLVANLSARIDALERRF